MSRIAMDSPGVRQNVPRPGQVYSGTMKRPGMNFSITKYVVVFKILFFLLNLETRNISATCKNMQHILRRAHKSGSSDADELRYGLAMVS